MMIPNLPFEIIEQMNSYLTQDDRYELVLTNHALNKVFTRLLYRTITVESNKQWQQLISNFENTKCSQISLGHYVHGICILLDELPETELRRLQQLCPFVQSIHIDWRIWNFLSFMKDDSSKSRDYQPREPTPFALQFMTHYGACKLSSLVLDLTHMTNINPANILSYTSRLRSLTLKHKTTLDYSFINHVHELCPYLETLCLDGYIAEPDNTQLDLIQPSDRMKCFQLKSQYGADHYQDWLPYIALKYPNIRYLSFYHSGEGKEMTQIGSSELYRAFLRRCPHLVHLGWHNTAPDFQFLKELDRPLQTLSILDSLPLNSLLTYAMFDNKHLQSLRRLEIGPLPYDIKPNDFIDAIGDACPRLQHLTLRETVCNLSQPFKIDVILDKCPHLISLFLVRIALRVSFPARANRVHPLQVLEMQHCSSFDGMFEHVSACCPQLRELRLFALTQRDRRYKVQIRLPQQQLKKVKLQGLRTESFDVHRRIRFFCIRDSDSTKWYYMDGYQVEDSMEESDEMKELNEKEVSLLNSIMQCKTTSEKASYIEQHLKSNPKSIAKNWLSNFIQDAGYVDIQCASVQRLYLNKHLIKN